jgi:hypothetical protein
MLAVLPRETLQICRQLRMNLPRDKPLDEWDFRNLKQNEIKMKLKLGKFCRVGQKNQVYLKETNLIKVIRDEFSKRNTYIRL